METNFKVHWLQEWTVAEDLNYLMLSFTGTEETHRLWCGRYRREDTEAAH